MWEKNHQRTRRFFGILGLGKLSDAFLLSGGSLPRVNTSVLFPTGMAGALLDPLMARKISSAASCAVCLVGGGGRWVVGGGGRRSGVSLFFGVAFVALVALVAFSLCDFCVLLNFLAFKRSFLW